MRDIQKNGAGDADCRDGEARLVVMADMEQMVAAEPEVASQEKVQESVGNDDGHEGRIERSVAVWKCSGEEDDAVVGDKTKVGSNRDSCLVSRSSSSDSGTKLHDQYDKSAGEDTYWAVSGVYGMEEDYGSTHQERSQRQPPRADEGGEEKGDSRCCHNEIKT